MKFILYILLLKMFSLAATAQPIQGCYFGAYPGCGSLDISCTNTAAFNAATGKSHNCFSRYINAGSDTDLLNPAHWLWANSLKTLLFIHISTGQNDASSTPTFLFHKIG